ncbi:MAG: glycosyltransferase family 2 protein [Tepidisphaeraceae bacterium]|jgi:glycosyltransferase involved in cell wall biosynthesis
MTFLTRTFRVPPGGASLPVQRELPIRETTAAPTEIPQPQPIAPAVGKKLILIPAFNESKSVAKLVQRLNKLLPDFDILVIDDGSTDDTVRQVPSNTTVVSLPFNLGIGGAMQTGYRFAALHGYDVAVQVDGDGQHRPSEVRKLVEALQTSGADLVVGSRFLVPNTFVQSFTRMNGIRVLSIWIWILSGLKITDCTSGFRAVNRRVIRAYAHWYPEDYPEPEVALLLHRSKFRVIEIPALMRRRMYGKSSISLARGFFYVLKVSVCLLLDMVREPWPSGKIGSP